MRKIKSPTMKRALCFGFVALVFLGGYKLGRCRSACDLKEKAQISQTFNKEVGPGITGRFIGNRFFLEGTAHSEYEADRAVEIAKALTDTTGRRRRDVAGDKAGAAESWVIDMVKVSRQAK